MILPFFFIQFQKEEEKNKQGKKIKKTKIKEVAFRILGIIIQKRLCYIEKRFFMRMFYSINILVFNHEKAIIILWIHQLTEI